MKKYIFIFFLSLMVIKSKGQSFQISFTGTGLITTVDTVRVENLTQGTSLIMVGTDTLYLISPSEIHELKLWSDNTIHIWPNPMESYCSIEFNTTRDDMASIELFSVSGNRILQYREFLVKGYHTYSLNGIGSGIFTLKIISESYLYVSKIISRNHKTGTAGIIHNGRTPGYDDQITLSNTGNLKSSMNTKSMIEMSYFTGDLLKLTGQSSIYQTIFMIVPDQTLEVAFHFVECTDVDNNYYSVVDIAGQKWMAENLKTTHYLNGDFILNITDGPLWWNMTEGASCDYGNIPGNSLVYGKLYNFYAVVDPRNICPTGWHVSTDSDWITLTNYLGGPPVAGGKLKETGKAHWLSPNYGATDESGFTALPGGYRYGDNGSYDRIGEYGYWWTTGEYNSNSAWYWEMNWALPATISSDYYKQTGLSVRCVKN